MNRIELKEVTNLNKETSTKLIKMLNKFSTNKETNTEYSNAFNKLEPLCTELLKSNKKESKIFGLKLLSTFRFHKETQRLIVNRLIELKFIEALLRSPTSIILRESKELIIIMAKQKDISKEYVTLIWNCFINFKTKEVSMILINIMIELCKEEISIIPIKRKMFKEASNCFLWELIFEQEIPQKSKELAISELVKSLNVEYFRQCIESIGDNFLRAVNVEASIYFLLKINFLDVLTNKEAEEFITKNDLIKSSIKLCTEYHKKIREYLKRSSNNVKAKLNFIEHANLYLNFLQMICCVSERCSIDNSNLDILWKLYYKEAVLAEFEDLLWDALKKENKQYYLGFFSSLHETTFFFKTYLLDPTYFSLATITLTAFTCFKRYFEFINNHKEKSIDDTLNDYIGLEALWTITLTNEYKALREDGTDFLITTYCQHINKEPTLLVQQFLTKIFKRSYNSPQQLKTALNILNLFTIRYYSTICL